MEHIERSNCVELSSFDQFSESAIDRRPLPVREVQQADERGRLVLPRVQTHICLQYMVRQMFIYIVK